MNNQHPTTNIQHPISRRAGGGTGCWLLDVGCWMFFIFTFLYAPPRLFSQAATNELSALVPAYGEIPPTFLEQHGMATQSGQAIFASIVLLAGLLFFVIWKKLHPPPPPILPPEVQACESLAKLLRQPEDGKTLSEVSQILRCYFASVLGLPPVKLTTTEICMALASQERIGLELVQPISDFLRKCDERKFSPALDATPLNAAARALELVAAAEGRRSRSAHVPGAAMSPMQDAPNNQQTQPSSDAAASGDGRTP